MSVVWRELLILLFAVSCGRRSFDPLSDAGELATACYAHVAVGSRFSCVIKADGTLWCTGENLWGELAVDMALPNQNRPIHVSTLMNVTSVALGGANACALAAGRVWCWGYNEQYDVGDGTTLTRYTPVMLPSLVDIVGIDVGNDTPCAWSASSVWCWGANGAGQVGDGTMGNVAMTPTLALFMNAVQIAGGGDHTCARRRDGTVWCWGLNASGQLGDNSTTSRGTPAQVALERIVHITAGTDHTCALQDRGELWCWGANSFGQLGDNATADRWLPTRVPNVMAKHVSAGMHHTCAVLVDDSVACWGDNDEGQLGDGTLAPHSEPRATSPLPRAAQVAAGDRSSPTFPDHSCARTIDGVWCWGANPMGQLGDGTFANAASPVRMLLDCP